MATSKKYLGRVKDQLRPILAAGLIAAPEHQECILAAVMADITREKHLNPRRRHRTCPRVVKRARHNSCRVKRPGDHGTRHSGPATIKLVNLHLPAA